MNFDRVVVFFILPVSWLETRLEIFQIGTYSISEAASDSKMPKNDKKQNFGKMAKTTFFPCFEATCSFSEAASNSKTLKMIEKPEIW